MGETRHSQLSAQLNLAEPRFVELHKRIDGSWTLVDSVSIIDGAYTFRGLVEEPTLARMWVHAECVRFVSVILERGAIKVLTNANWKSTITGTRNNNIRQPFLDAEFVIQQRINETSRAFDQAQQDED